jgi:hypothetical protein
VNEISPSAWALNISTTATTTTISTIRPGKSEEGTNNEEIKIKSLQGCYTVSTSKQWLTFQMVRVPPSSELGSPTGPVDTAQHPRRHESSNFDPIVTTCPIPSNKATLLHLNCQTHTQSFLLFVCFHGRLQATMYYSLLAFCTARFGHSNFGQQMPPRLSRSAL